MCNPFSKILMLLVAISISTTCFAVTKAKPITDKTIASHTQSEASKLEIYGEDKQNIVLTKSDNAEFSIQLKSNPTTGFSWFLREYNSDLITPISHKFLPPEKKLLGAGGAEVWTFKVNKIAFTVPMQTTLRLIYARPWQGSDTASQLNFRVSTVPQY